MIRESFVANSKKKMKVTGRYAELLNIKTGGTNSYHCPIKSQSFLGSAIVNHALMKKVLEAPEQRF
jgi:hypothetical protein